MSPKRDGHSSATPVARRLKQPTRTATRTRAGTRVPLPSLFGLAPGGVCRAVSVAGNAVRSYRTVSPLPRPIHNAPWRSLLCGTVPGVAPRRMLSGTVCPGARTFLPGHLSVIAGAAVQPTDSRRDGVRSGCRQEAGEGGLGQKIWSKLLWLGRRRLLRLGGRLLQLGVAATNSFRNVCSVVASVMPSTCACRKWRWKAVMTSMVARRRGPKPRCRSRIRPAIFAGR